MTIQTNDYINEIRERLTTNLSPEKIILFGSYASGIPDKNSDVDMLIITNRILPQKGRSIIAEKLMSGIQIPTDFLIYTSAEVEKLKTIKSHIIYEIIRKGKVIYEK